ncbi:hypothetical protein [Cupriavidus pauculus]|uniref:hypothetical protein n=1 Tax=Cupriavidus pauculus TaxID=82633 RepID=UPI001EE1FA94|nr:hypothetical protein [Cupriavidus pauculus]GJG98563.1 hypothetical protein CBA19C6_28760 [Cupriavidus pauculus]
MKPQKLWMLILAIVLAFATVGVAGATVYRMWQQAIAPVHVTAAALWHIHS